jgi:hypothetical protein
LKNGNIAANLPQYCQTFAIYMEGLLPVTMKMPMNGKHGKWNKTKKKHLASLLVGIKISSLLLNSTFFIVNYQNFCLATLALHFHHQKKNCQIPQWM